MSQVYKLCDCGHLNIFEDTEVAPRKCAKCPRNLLTKEIFPLSKYKPQEEKAEEPAPETKPEPAAERSLFKLVNREKNIEILLPPFEDCVLGRAGLGAEFMPNTVGRKHLYIFPVGRMKLSVKDENSLNGTLINGELLPKGEGRMLLPGDTITLDAKGTGITFELAWV